MPDRATIRQRRQMVGEAPLPATWATPDERQAVDALVQDGFSNFERSQLLPFLLALQARLGRLSKGVLGYAGERVGLPFSDVYGVASFYALLNTSDAAVAKVRLCSSVPCLLAGAEAIAETLGQPGTSWEWFPCLGQCERAPAALLGEEPICNLRPDTARAALGLA